MEPAIDTPSERRNFSRVAFDAHAELVTTQASLRVQVLDLSLKGALLRLQPAGGVAPGAPCMLRIQLAALDNTAIAMAGEIAHVEGEHAGMICRSIDLESITHLRRLIEMNLGDAALLDRDLKSLVTTPQQ
ncbi:PilZ domain-containing protein [Pelomonas sp. KK5]|uniref:PilZ domain-containing protein n=1 Tax=Pelomonas sp. KK5 TaxID=1855730 RepID=UPI00097C19F4|nr:PilZ domain-containing protein [Pelomonas sp. KK5]